jgi:hypothetical protein
MEDVLAVYTRPHDPDRPLVCVDETSKQLIAETCVPIPMKPGRPGRFDYEYERNWTANLFMMFAPLEGWRHVQVTDRHSAVDYAHVLKELADVHFAKAKTIALVQDNLNIHSKASLYEAFPAAEARGGGTPLILALGKDRKAYLLDRNNLGGIGGQLAVETVSERSIITAPVTYPAADGIFVGTSSRRHSLSNSDAGTSHPENPARLAVGHYGSLVRITTWQRRSDSDHDRWTLESYRVGSWRSR